MPLFYWLLDTAIVNSYIIYRMDNPLVLQKQFRLELSKALRECVDHIHILVKKQTQRNCKALECTVRTWYACCTYCVVHVLLPPNFLSFLSLLDLRVLNLYPTLSPHEVLCQKFG